MIAMLVCRLLAPERTRGRATSFGFTLLELLVVLALMALIAGLAAPRAVSALEGARQRAVERELRLVLAGLPLEAFRAGTALEVSVASLQARISAWPSGWSIELEQPLAYSAEGGARGGVVRVRNDQGRVQAFLIEPYTGALRPLVPCAQAAATMVRSELMADASLASAFLRQSLR